MYFPFFFFFNDTATTEIYTLSLQDALPISANPFVTSLPRMDTDGPRRDLFPGPALVCCWKSTEAKSPDELKRSEEHTSELQSRSDLVCRLLLEKKKTITLNT